MKKEEMFEICRKAEAEVTEIFARDEKGAGLYTDEEFDLMKTFSDLWNRIEELGYKKPYIHYCIEKEKEELFIRLYDVDAEIRKILEDPHDVSEKNLNALMNRSEKMWVEIRDRGFANEYRSWRERRAVYAAL